MKGFWVLPDYRSDLRSVRKPRRGMTASTRPDTPGTAAVVAGKILAYLIADPRSACCFSKPARQSAFPVCNAALQAFTIAKSGLRSAIRAVGRPSMVRTDAPCTGTGQHKQARTMYRLTRTGQGATHPMLANRHAFP